MPNQAEFLFGVYLLEVIQRRINGCFHSTPVLELDSNLAWGFVIVTVAFLPPVNIFSYCGLIRHLECGAVP